MTEASKATPLPGAVLQWLWDAPDATAPAITTVSDAASHFVLARPARAESRLVLGLSYRANTVAVPVTDAPYLRVALRADQELGEVIVNYRTDKTAPEALRTAIQKPATTPTISRPMPAPTTAQPTVAKKPIRCISPCASRAK
jgi:hypothetical protein